MDTVKEPRKHSIEWWKKQDPEYLRRQARLSKKLFWLICPIAILFLGVLAGINIYFNQDNPDLYVIHWIVLGITSPMLVITVAFMSINAYRFRKWADEREKAAEKTEMAREKSST